MSDDVFRNAVREQIAKVWKKSFNPFDKERPRVAKYPASVIEMVEVEIDGKPMIFLVRISPVSMETEGLAEQMVGNMPNTEETIGQEVRRVVGEFNADMAAGNFVPIDKS